MSDTEAEVRNGYLCLSREQGESIQVWRDFPLYRIDGDTLVEVDADIDVHVIGIYGNKVRIGFHAERDVHQIDRHEIYDDKQFELNMADKENPNSERVSPGIDQVPLVGLRALGRIFAEGEAKYGRDQWKTNPDGGADYERERLRHAIDHLYRWAEGDRDEEHLPKVAWFCFTQMWREQQREAGQCSPKE